MLHFLGPAHLTLVYFLSYSVFLSVLIHWKLCLWEIVTLWVKLSGVRLREGRVRKWRARERVREIEDGVALLKDMAETVCLHSGPAGSGSFDLVWPGFSIPSSLSLALSFQYVWMWDAISHNQHKPGPAHSTSGPDTHHSAPPVFHSSISLSCFSHWPYLHAHNFVIKHILSKPLFQERGLHVP